MHSSRMRTARSSSRTGGVLHKEHPPGPGTSPDQAQPLGTRHPPGSRPPRDQAPPRVDRITDAYENITLPQLRCGR